MTTPTDAGLLLPYTYGRGYPTLSQPASPAAGATYTTTVPGSRMYQLATVRAVLTTSAAVANRQPRLILTDNDGHEYARVAWTTAVTATTTIVLTWARGVDTAAAGADGSALMPLPDAPLMEGHKILIDVGAIDPADTLTGIALRWDELPIGGHGYPIGIQPALPPLVT